MNVHVSCSLQLGDRSFYTLKEGDAIVTADEWRRYETRCFNMPKKKGKNKTKGKNNKQAEAAVEESSEIADESDKEEEEDDDDEYEDIEDDAENADGDDEDEDDASDPLKCLEHRKLRSRRKLGASRQYKTWSKGLNAPEAVTVRPGDTVAVETLITKSTVDVVWQVGQDNGFSGIFMKRFILCRVIALLFLYR